MNLTELKLKQISEVIEIAESLGLENFARSRKQDLIFAILKKQAKAGDDISGDGVLEILQDGFGFLRTPGCSYLAGPDDIYVSPSQIRRFSLKTNFEPPENTKNKITFSNLTPLFAKQRFVLEQGNGTSEDLTGRIIDLIAPIGKGQRGLIVSPPKAGKTMILQSLAQAIAEKNPECYLIVLLIDERPE
ncbi:MAG: Rho termination factor N-terminal domain-containing protein, partial [Methylococcaceae bacterium]